MEKIFEGRLSKDNLKEGIISLFLSISAWITFLHYVYYGPGISSYTLDIFLLISTLFIMTLISLLLISFGPGDFYVSEDGNISIPQPRICRIRKEPIEFKLEQIEKLTVQESLTRDMYILLKSGRIIRFAFQEGQPAKEFKEFLKSHFKERWSVVFEAKSSLPDLYRRQKKVRS